MTCECQTRGFCPRRNAYVPRPQWRLCQAGHEASVDKVIQDLEQVKVEYKKDKKSKERKERIRKRADQRQRFKKWIMLLRTPKDKGLGDTIFRLRQTTMHPPRPKPEIHAILNEILKECSCTTHKAVEHLNNVYPYANLS